MKKLLLACLFLIAIAIQAQETSDFKTETIEFIKITGGGAAFDGAIEQIGYNVPEAKKEAYIKEAKTTLDGLYSKMADLYMEEFTQSEIRELVAFYHTDLGKKLATKQLSLTQKAMMYGQTWGMEVSQIAQKYNE